MLAQSCSWSQPWRRACLPARSRRCTATELCFCCTQGGWMPASKWCSSSLKGEQSLACLVSRPAPGRVAAVCPCGRVAAPDGPLQVFCCARGTPNTWLALCCHASCMNCAVPATHWQAGLHPAHDLLHRQVHDFLKLAPRTAMLCKVLSLSHKI